MRENHPESGRTTKEQQEIADKEEREHRRTTGDSGKPTEAIGDSGRSGTHSSSDQMSKSGRKETDDTDYGREEEQLHLPQIALGQSLRLETAERIEDTPGDSGRLVDVPQVQLGSPDLLERGKISEKLLIETDASDITVPQFTPETTNWLEPQELEDDQQKAIKRIQQVQIPQVSMDRKNRTQPFETFLDTIPTNNSLANGMKKKPIPDKQGEETESANRRNVSTNNLDELEAENDWISADLPDPLELLFGSDGVELKSDNPIVVLVDDDDFIGVVETVVKRLYREKVGGEPDLKKFDTAEQLANEERWMSADSRIFTAELSDEEWEKIENRVEYKDAWRSIWKNRFDQLFSGQQFGAIVFNRDQVPGIEVTSLPHHPPELVQLGPGVAWTDFGDVFWNGEEMDANRARTFSQLFDRDVNGLAQDQWKQIKRSADGKFNLATDSDDAASDDHYAMKVFVVKWLAEELWQDGLEFVSYDALEDIRDYREIESTIPTEQPVAIADGNSVKADVKYKSLVFEVEMFFEEGNDGGIMSKLQQTVRKYERVKEQIDEINIVVDNLTCVLHLKEFARFKRNHRPWEEDNADINFYTLNLCREELIPVNNIADQITELSLQ